MAADSSPAFRGLCIYAVILWFPPVFVFAPVFGIAWIALAALAVWAVLFVAIGFAILLALNEFCRPGIFASTVLLVVTGTASLLSALGVAGFLGA